MKSTKPLSTAKNGNPSEATRGAGVNRARGAVLASVAEAIGRAGFAADPRAADRLLTYLVSDGDAVRLLDGRSLGELKDLDHRLRVMTDSDVIRIAAGERPITQRDRDRRPREKPEVLPVPDTTERPTDAAAAKEEPDAPRL